MQTSDNFDDQPVPENFPMEANNHQTVAAHGQEDVDAQPTDQAGFMASISDDLFHPVPGNLPSNVFTLPDVPYNPNPRYNVPRILPHPSSLSSYNNPSFVIPPPVNQTGLPPPTPPVYHNTQPAYQPPQPSYHHSQPTYPNNIAYHHHPQPVYYHPQPAYHPPQPAYYHPQPAYYHPQPTYHHPPPTYHQFQPNNPAYNQFFQNPNPLVQLDDPIPLVPSGLSSLSKSLPTVSHIPLLTSKSDFPAWDEGVNALIRANGLIGHILDPMVAVDITRPDLTPVPIPILPVTPSVADIASLNRWWDEDNVAQHILVSRLGSIPRGLLPAPNIVTRTALSIYKLLLEYYGTCNFADCTLLLNSLQNSTCTAGRVQEFVSKWRTGLSRLQSARFIFNIKICMGLFVRGLPSTPAFNSIQADLPERIAAIPHEQDYGAFITLTEKVLQLDTIFCSIPQSHLSRPTREPTVAVTTQTTTTASPSSVVAPAPHMSKHCNNCKSRGLRSAGHTDATCFQQGGGMEGRREEYLSNKGRVHAMFAEYLENALLLDDQPLPSDSLPSFFSSSSPGPPILDDEPVIPPIANLCITSFSANSDLRGDLYSPCDSKSFSHFAYTSANFQSAALLSMVSLYNALLDSGCTHHIIRDRTLFRSYVANAISVGTANCGSLEALGSGDVEFRYPFGDRYITFTLRGCLYAPTAPINLLSVGALVERGMSCLFSPGGLTRLSYPDDHSQFPVKWLH